MEQASNRSSRMIRTLLVAATLVSAANASTTASAADKPAATLYKNPQCECCESYASYLRDNGFEGFEGCHTMGIEGYIVEGHVPIKTLNRLLVERPKIRGISLPGMPEGSPGMTGRKTALLTIYEFSGGAAKVYAVE